MHNHELLIGKEALFFVLPQVHLLNHGSEVVDGVEHDNTGGIGRQKVNSTDKRIRGVPPQLVHEEKENLQDVEDNVEGKDLSLQLLLQLPVFLALVWLQNDR